MKKLRLSNLLWALCLVMVAGLWSCNDEDVDGEEPFVTSEPAALTFNANDGLTQKVTIKSNRDWTISTNAAWVACTPDKGSGNAEVEVTVLANPDAQRTAKLTITASIATATIDITQAGKGGTVLGEALYQENCGESVDKVNDKWPYTDQYTGWKKAGSLDQSGVTYSGSGANVSDSGPNFDPADGSQFSNAPYVGLNYSSSSPQREFDINNINITGKTNFTFTFGSAFQNAYPIVLGSVTESSFKLSMSVNGTDWSEVSYKVQQESSGNWYLCTAEFKVPEGSTKLSVKFVTSPQENQGYRIDDFKLYEGGNGELLGQGGGDEPVEKVYKTISEIRALYKGSNVTIAEDVWVKGVVITDKDGGNAVSKKNKVISDGIAGLALRLKADDATYAFGDEIEFPVKNISLERYQNGAMQLNGVDNATIQKIGTKTIEVKSITAAQLVSGDYESMYVAVSDVQVVEADKGKTFATPESAHGSLNFESKTGEDFIVFTAKYAVFAGNTVPEGSGVLKGVASVNGGKIQVLPNVATDYADLTGDRFTVLRELTFGTPSFSGSLVAGSALTNAKISIPYEYAEGNESYDITVAVSGTGSAGINAVTTPVTKTITAAGSGNIEVAITGTPTTVGAVTFTISGITGLTTTTVNAEVRGAGGAYTSNVSLPENTSTSANPAKLTASIGGKDYDILKLGTSKKIGTYTTEPIPSGTSLKFYAVAWKGKTARLKVTVNGGGTIDGGASKTFDLVGNIGATSNPPFTIEFGDNDVYTATLSGVTENSTLTIETLDDDDNPTTDTTVGRAIIVGINVE